MKLKEIYQQVRDEQNQPQVNLEEVKAQFNEQIKQFKNHATTLYNMGKYREIAEYFSKLAENANNYIMTDVSEGGFDQVTVKRNLNELRKYASDFSKVSGEAQALQERMAALYEDMGVILNRYVDVPESVEEAMDAIGHEDSDVNNDGKVNAEDQYLMKRRKAIAQSKADDEPEQKQHLARMSKDIYERNMKAQSKIYESNAGDKYINPNSYSLTADKYINPKSYSLGGVDNSKNELAEKKREYAEFKNLIKTQLSNVSDDTHDFLLTVADGMLKRIIELERQDRNMNEGEEVIKLVHLSGVDNGY